LLLLLLELPQVKVELLSLEDITVRSARLTGSGGDASKESTRLEQVSDILLQSSLGLSSRNLGLDVTGLLNLLNSLGLILLLGEIDTIVLQVPLSERGGINLNNSVLGQGLSSDELLVGRIVDGVEDSGLVSGI
jgi:hypothetical protein